MREREERPYAVVEVVLRVLDRLQRLDARLGERVLHAAADARKRKLPFTPPLDAHLPTHRRVQVRNDVVQTHQNVRPNRRQRVRLQRAQSAHHLLLVLPIQQRRQRNHHANRRFAHARRRVRQPQNHLRENIAVHHALVDQLDVAVQVLARTAPADTPSAAADASRGPSDRTAA